MLASSKQAATRTARILAVFLVVGLVTGFYRAIEFANTTTIALSFLLVVLAVAARWGLAEAITTSVLATLSFNYFFLPPTGTWTIADPANWVSLFVFLAVSVVASQLSERARRRTREAIEQRQETERLYTLSRMILMLGGHPAGVAGEITRQVEQVFGATGVALFHCESGQIFRAGSVEVPLSDAQLKEIPLLGNVLADTAANFVALPISLGGKMLGSLAVVGASLSDGARQAVANLIAIALESARSREVASQAELVRQSEEFKSTLIDALAHELKTPLTSVKAAASGLLAETPQAAANQRELLTIIDEETDRLNRMVFEALQMAKIEAGKLHLDRQASSVESLIHNAIANSKRLLEGREVQEQFAPGLPAVSADTELIETVLRHLLDNAAQYTPRGKPVRVSAELDDRQVHIRIADQGPGLSEEELSHVFDRYYRGARTRDTVPGVGMGLAIARDIVLAHGGRMWAESAPGQGARFSFTLPVADDSSPH